MRLVLMGPPGAGKGTQGELLADRFGVPRYSTGDILREAVREGTQMGQAARRYMDAGELVPDDVILGIVDEALARPAAEMGFVFDGFPRTVPQAEGLRSLLRSRGADLDAVIELVVPDEELLRRLTARRVCGSCGAVGSAGAEGEDGQRCPECGGAMRQRRDDRPETVRRRLDVHRAETEPLLAWYRRASVPVLQVSGSGRVGEVQARLLAELRVALGERAAG